MDTCPQVSISWVNLSRVLAVFLHRQQAGHKTTREHSFFVRYSNVLMGICPRQACIDMHLCNAVLLVWDLLRLVPINSSTLICTCIYTSSSNFSHAMLAVVFVTLWMHYILYFTTALHCWDNTLCCYVFCLLPQRSVAEVEWNNARRRNVYRVGHKGKVRMCIFYISLGGEWVVRVGVSWNNTGRICLPT